MRWRRPPRRPARDGRERGQQVAERALLVRLGGWLVGVGAVCGVVLCAAGRCCRLGWWYAISLCHVGDAQSVERQWPVEFVDVVGVCVCCGDLQHDGVVHLQACLVVDTEVCDKAVGLWVGKDVISACGSVSTLCTTSIVARYLSPLLCLCSHIQ